MTHTFYLTHISSHQINDPFVQVKMKLAKVEIYLKNSESHINRNRRSLLTLDKNFPDFLSTKRLGEVRHKDDWLHSKHKSTVMFP